MIYFLIKNIFYHTTIIISNKPLIIRWVTTSKKINKGDFEGGLQFFFEINDLNKHKPTSICLLSLTNSQSIYIVVFPRQVINNGKDIILYSHYKFCSDLVWRYGFGFSVSIRVIRRKTRERDYVWEKETRFVKKLCIFTFIIYKGKHVFLSNLICFFFNHVSKP